MLTARSQLMQTTVVMNSYSKHVGDHDHACLSNIQDYCADQITL